MLGGRPAFNPLPQNQTIMEVCKRGKRGIVTHATHPIGGLVLQSLCTCVLEKEGTGTVKEEKTGVCRKCWRRGGWNWDGTDLPNFWLEDEDEGWHRQRPLQVPPYFDLSVWRRRGGGNDGFRDECMHEFLRSSIKRPNVVNWNNQLERKLEVKPISGINTIP